MFSDRRASTWINGILGAAVLVAVGAIGKIAYDRRRADQPLPFVEPIAGLREARRRATAAERRGDYAQSEREYHTALGLKPESAELRVGLARSCLALRKRDEARKTYQPTVEAYYVRRRDLPGGAGTLAWYGDLCAEGGDAAGADRAYRAASRWYLGAGTTAMGGHVQTSSRSGERPSGEPPSRLAASAHLVGSYAARRDRDLGEAERHLRRAVELDPQSLGARVELGELRFVQGRDKDGWTELEAAKAIGKPAERGWIALAQTINDHGRLGEALSMLGQAEKAVPPADAEALCALGETYRRMADRPAGVLKVPGDAKVLARARRVYERAWRLAKPDDGGAWLRLASGAFDKPRRLEAAERARRSTLPQDTSASLSLAELIGDAGRKAEARAMLVKALPYAGTSRSLVENAMRRFSDPPSPARVATGGAPAHGRAPASSR